MKKRFAVINFTEREEKELVKSLNRSKVTELHPAVVQEIADELGFDIGLAILPGDGLALIKL